MERLDAARPANADSGTYAFDSRCTILTSSGATMPREGETISAGDLTPQCQVLIPVYPFMQAGDAVLLQWIVDASTDQPVLFAQQQITSGDSAESYAASFNVPSTTIWQGTPYRALVGYTVKPAVPSGFLLVSAKVSLFVTA